eukprot:scaffold740_cov270-Pinguiococcus_pyrenoidosus.AAC.2
MTSFTKCEGKRREKNVKAGLEEARGTIVHWRSRTTVAMRLPPIPSRKPLPEATLDGKALARTSVDSSRASARKSQSAKGTHSASEATATGRHARSRVSLASKSATSASRTTQGDTRGSRKKRKAKPWWHLSVKLRRLVWFVVSESVLVILITFALLHLNGQMMNLYQNAAVNQLELMQMSYEIKTDQIAQLAALLTRNEPVLSLLRAPPAEQQNRSSATYLQAFELLESELNYRQIEYAILLNSSGQIVVSGNDERQRLKSALRTGEHFDPGNLVQRILSDTNGTNE